ncbi:MAG: succinylglutamate desuccinylase/aspartoacylase family protein [Planctomycetes bacterium]|nr:succinylglutamate desuccinylase/aspartoacylase family protein [Planctomycetota bacterium]
MASGVAYAQHRLRAGIALAHSRLNLKMEERMARVELKSLPVDLVGGERYEVRHWEVTARAPGPCVLITAALHGNEVQGSEVLRRVLPLLRRGLRKGVCLLVPMANPCAIQRHWPHIDFEHGRTYSGDRVNNVNCTWPGDAGGSNAQRLSHALFQTLVERATHSIDIHCWSCVTAAAALAVTGDRASIELAGVSGLRFARHMQWLPKEPLKPDSPRILTGHFAATGRPAVAVELSGQYGFWPREVAWGVRAVKNWLRHVGMLSGEPEVPDGGPIWLNDNPGTDVPSPRAGLFVPQPSYATSVWVEAGRHVFAADDLSTTVVQAPVSGYLYQLRPAHEKTSEHTMMWLHPHVKDGEVLAKICAPSAPVASGAK